MNGHQLCQGLLPSVLKTGHMAVEACSVFVVLLSVV